MIEIDSRIINSDVLLERVVASVRVKAVAAEFLNTEEHDIQQGISIQEKMRDQLKCALDNLQVMHESWMIRESEIVSSKRIIGGGIVFCKKVFRKLTRWLVSPYINQQSVFNQTTTRAIGNLIQTQQCILDEMQQAEGGILHLNERAVNQAREKLLLFYSELQTMNAAAFLQERPIVSQRPVVGKVVVNIKKAIRKATRWLVRPYCEQQMVFNRAAIKTATCMIQVQELMLSEYTDDEE